MRILVCASQVPFVRGGAEMLSEGLCQALREQGHQAELVAVPLTWKPVSALLRCALAWRLLDVSESDGKRIDRVIATKFPTYAVRHPHKIVWLVHQYRQAYDWFGTPFSELTGTRADHALRETIFELDRRTLGEAQARFAISKNVAARLKTYNELDAAPLYPPPRCAGQFRAGPYDDYVLYLGRLDRAKRVDLLLHALAKTRQGRVIIAGSGPELHALKTLARLLRVNDRVDFTGYVSDARVIDLYAHARAVFYAPLDEDYGYATIEAFMSARPVITTNDAGGVLEFVEHQSNGLVTAPKAEAIADALAQVWSNPEQCRRWGQAGRERVQQITWKNVVDHLTA